MEKLGREKQLYQGGKQQSKERRGPLSIHSSATWKPNMSSGIHTYPFSLGLSKSPTRILYALKTFDLHSVQNLQQQQQQQQQISYTELSNHDALQVNSFCLNSAHVSPG